VAFAKGAYNALYTVSLGLKRHSTITEPLVSLGDIYYTGCILRPNVLVLKNIFTGWSLWACHLVALASGSYNAMQVSL
jgi:hypothetical protein